MAELQTLDDVLWNHVLAKKETLERICNLEVGAKGRGAAKALAECQMQEAYKNWWDHVTR